MSPHMSLLTTPKSLSGQPSPGPTQTRSRGWPLWDFGVGGKLCHVGARFKTLDALIFMALSVLPCIFLCLKISLWNYVKLNAMVQLLEATFLKGNKIWTCTIVLHWSQSRSQSHETLTKSLGISLTLVYKSQSQSRSRINKFQSLSLSLGLEKPNTKVSVSVSVSKNRIPKSQYQSQYQKSWSRRPLIWFPHIFWILGRNDLIEWVPDGPDPQGAQIGLSA